MLEVGQRYNTEASTPTNILVRGDRKVPPRDNRTPPVLFRVPKVGG